MVMPEGADTVSRPSPDYPMLPTIPLSAFSDPKKNKPSHGSKVSEVEGQRCGAWAWPLAIAGHFHHLQSPALHTCRLHLELLLLLLVPSLAILARSGAWNLAAHPAPSSSSVTGLMSPLSCPVVICDPSHWAGHLHHWSLRYFLGSSKARPHLPLQLPGLPVSGAS